jgi:hypothetical protein
MARAAWHRKKDTPKTSSVGTIALNFDRIMIPTLLGWIFAVAQEANQNLSTLEACKEVAEQLSPRCYFFVSICRTQSKVKKVTL